MSSDTSADVIPRGPLFSDPLSGFTVSAVGFCTAVIVLYQSFDWVAVAFGTVFFIVGVLAARDMIHYARR